MAVRVLMCVIGMLVRHARAPEYQTRYTSAVRVSVASILVFLLVTIACLDPWCCSDGCDRGGMAATQTAQTGGDCPTCLSALMPRQLPVVVRPDVAVEIRDMTALPLVPPFLAAVDHPPRFS